LRYRASLLNGVPFYILVICIPQRFQTINSLSPFQTGVRLLPLTFLASLGGILANVTAAKARVPPIYIMWTFSALTTIGCGLLTTLPATETIPRAAYGYMTLAGLGLGATFSISVLVTPFVAEARDLGKPHASWHFDLPSLTEWNHSYRNWCSYRIPNSWRCSWSRDCNQCNGQLSAC
jgi:hypothetical protein